MTLLLFICFQMIKLVFVTLDVTCNEDIMTIKEGSGERIGLDVAYCGSIDNLTVYSENTTINIQLTTDLATGETENGFKFIVEFLCELYEFFVVSLQLCGS